MARILWLALTILTALGGATAQTPGDTKQVRHTIDSFYAAFNTHGFEHAAQFTTDDWNHINPYGGRTQGREAVLKELREVHSGFLKGVSDTINDVSIRFAAPDAAIATVTSQMSTYHSPDGVTHQNERHIRTFIIVRRAHQWLIMQDQNTVIRD
jgi:uncharacterized protein (TIGR02246 family)